MYFDFRHSLSLMVTTNSDSPNSNAFACSSDMSPYTMCLEKQLGVSQEKEVSQSTSYLLEF